MHFTDTEYRALYDALPENVAMAKTWSDAATEIEKSGGTVRDAIDLIYVKLRGSNLIGRLTYSPEVDEIALTKLMWFYILFYRIDSGFYRVEHKSNAP